MEHCKAPRPHQNIRPERTAVSKPPSFLLRIILNCVLLMQVISNRNFNQVLK